MIDVLINGSSVSTIGELLRSLQHDFAIKDVDSLNFLLGIEAVHSSGKLLLSQQPYILDILNRSK